MVFDLFVNCVTVKTLYWKFISFLKYSIPACSSFATHEVLPEGCINFCLCLLNWQKSRNQASEEATERVEATETDEKRGEDTNDMQYENELAWYYKAFWIMYSITTNVTLAITVFYYGSFLFRVNPDESGVDLVNDLTKHAFGTVFLLTETMISGIPVFFSQVIFPLIFTASYMVFSVIFWLAEGTNPEGKKEIYPGIGYDITPAGYVVLGVFLFASTQLISQLVFCGIYMLRRRFCETCSG